MEREIFRNLSDGFSPESHNINKKDLALKVLSQVFGFNDNDKIEVSQQIDFLYNCGKIKKSTFLTSAKHFLSDLLTIK